jgi:hypothetical protein
MRNTSVLRHYPHLKVNQLIERFPANTKEKYFLKILLYEGDIWSWGRAKGAGKQHNFHVITQLFLTFQLETLVI